MSYTTVSISLLYHNSSLCVLKDNKVDLFLQAERVTRKKNQNFMELTNFDVILKSVSVINKLVLVCVREEVGLEIVNYFKQNNVCVHETVHVEEHHLYHAISGFFMSGFKESSVIVVDGVGKLYDVDNYSIGETTSYLNLSYKKNKLVVENLLKTFHYDPGSKLNKKIVGSLPHINNVINDKLGIPSTVLNSPDVGYFYHIATCSLNFGIHEEGKTMGLSTYGTHDKNLFKHELNDKLFDVEKKAFNLNNAPEFKLTSFQKRANVAFFTQKVFEKKFKEKVEKLTLLSNSKNIIIAGGCALNVINNTYIADSFPKHNIFVDPIANDASIALGAAVEGYFQSDCVKDFTPQKIDSISWGPVYTNEDIIKSINNYSKNENCSNN